MGVSGYAIDDWLKDQHRVSAGLSDARHLLAIVATESTAGDIRALSRGLADCVAQLRSGKLLLPAVGDAPRIASLSTEMACDPLDAVFGPVEQVPLKTSAGRIAAEMIAPAPPGVPRLVPGQRIMPAHLSCLTANRNLGAFFLDPINPSEYTIRVAARE